MVINRGRNDGMFISSRQRGETCATSNSTHLTIDNIFYQLLISPWKTTHYDQDFIPTRDKRRHEIYKLVALHAKELAGRKFATKGGLSRAAPFAPW